MKIRSTGLLFVVALAAGCNSYTPFTKELRDEFGDDLSNLQFYVSSTMELKRELRSEERGVTGGHILIEEGRRIELVRLKKHTPGVLANVEEGDPDVLHMMFEPDADSERWFVFALQPDPNPRKSRKRSGDDDDAVDAVDDEFDEGGQAGGAAMQSDRPELYWLRSGSEAATIQYEGRTYAVSRFPHLLIDLKQVVQVESQKRVLPGVRLAEPEGYPQDDGNGASADDGADDGNGTGKGAAKTEKRKLPPRP